MKPLDRWCPECEAKLDEDAHPRRKFCSVKCKERAKKRKQRAGAPVEAETTRLKRKLSEARNRIIALETELAKARGRSSEHRVAKEMSAAAAKKFGGQIEDVREGLAADNIRLREELAAAKVRELAAANRSASEVLSADTATVNELKQQLAVATQERDMATARSQQRLAKYKELAERYQRLAADRAALIKEHDRMSKDLSVAYDRSDELEAIIQDWDYLAAELAAATGGRGRDDREHRMLAIWQSWRDGHAARGHGHGHVAGQEAGR